MYPIKLLFLLLTVALFSGCDKKDPEPPEPPQLTPMTTTGAETLSFLKDGEVWIADQDGFSPVSSISQSGRRFSVDSAVRLGPNQQEIFVLGFVLEDYEPKKYYDFERSFGGGFYPEYDLGIYCVTRDGYEVYSNSPEDTFNFVDITYFDFSGNFNIIAGTFQLRMINVENEECQDTIYITDGRFDLEFKVKP